jgi:hypothetical protein
MPKFKVHNKHIYCEDLGKRIYESGCYDAKGSTICRACSVKPTSEKIKQINTLNKKKR